MKRTTQNYLDEIDSKIVDLKDEIEALKRNDTISKTTRGTQLYGRGRELRVLQLVRQLVEPQQEIKLSDNNAATFLLITRLREERPQSVSIDFNEGDAILEILSKYSDVKRLKEKMDKVCQNKSLKLDYQKGIVVKA